MSDRGGRFRRPQPRPPWWPEDAPWPPPPGPWQQPGQRFIRRIGCFFAVVIALFIIGNIVVYQLFGQHRGDGDRRPWPFGLVFIIVAVIVIVTVIRTFRRTAAPIGDVMEAAERVASGDYTATVPPRGSPEVQQLAASFNAMTARLRSNEEQRRQLLADVAHELRTPLAVVRGNLEGMLDGVYPRDDAQISAIIEQTSHMARLLEDLRTLSLAEAGTLRLFREPTDLAVLLTDVASAFRAAAESAGVTLSISAPAIPDIDVDPTRLREVLDNLVSNALRYTPSGGSIRLDASLAPDRQHVLISVVDTGSGIAPEVLPHLFQRFAKSADSGGSGLGLAIAKRLVDAHGGEIGITSNSGEGTSIRVSLPIEA